MAAVVGAFILLDAMRPLLLPDPDLQPLASAASLPRIAFRDETGREITLGDFAGRIVLVNVWATWCPPCRDEMPSLDALQRDLGGADFEVVAIATDVGGVPSVRAYYDRHDIRSLAVYVDHDRAATAGLGVAGLPTTLLVDRDGREIGRTVGPADWSGEGARRLILRHARDVGASR